MPVKIFWQDNTQQIMCYELTGKWTWDEFYPEYNKAIAMMKSVPHRVDAIIDARSSGSIPVNILSHIKSIADKRPSNIGLSVILSTNKVLLNLFDVGCRFYPKIKHSFFFAPSLEEAQQLIATHRQAELLKDAD